MPTATSSPITIAAMTAMPIAAVRHRSTFARTLVRAGLCVIAAVSCVVAAHAQTVPVRLIGFNDFHGNLEAGNNSLQLADPEHPGHMLKVPVGSAASLAGLVGTLRGEARHSVVLSSGDLIGAAPLVSTLFKHESTVAVMNAMGLDFSIVGNHEFDGGVDELRRLVRGECSPASAPGTPCADGKYPGMRFTMLAANVIDADGQPIFAPTLVKEFEGLKIGFIGVVTRTTPGIVRPSGIRGLKFLDEAKTLNRYAAELQRQGVQAIVAVVHEGGEVEGDWNDTACAKREGAIFKIAERLAPSIDVVFSAHTHQGYNCVIDTPHQKGLRVVQATSYGRGVSVVDVELDPATHDIDRSKTRSRNLPVVNQTQGPYQAVARNEAIATVVADYVKRAAPMADRPVGSITARIDRNTDDGQGDTPAGRLIADAQLDATRAPAAGGAQLALMNSGGIRAALACEGTPPCTVTFGQAFTMQPFGNSLVVMTLTGKQLKALLEDQQTPRANAPHFLQPSRSLGYTWKRSAPYNERVTELMLDGVPVQGEARYRVVVNGFLAEGGDGFKRLVDGTERMGGPNDVDALIDFLGAHQPYAPDAKPRIRVID